MILGIVRLQNVFVSFWWTNVSTVLIYSSLTSISYFLTILVFIYAKCLVVSLADFLFLFWGRDLFIIDVYKCFMYLNSNPLLFYMANYHLTVFGFSNVFLVSLVNICSCWNELLLITIQWRAKLFGDGNRSRQYRKFLKWLGGLDTWLSWTIWRRKTTNLVLEIFTHDNARKLNDSVIELKINYLPQ